MELGDAPTITGQSRSHPARYQGWCGARQNMALDHISILDLDHWSGIS